MKKILLIEDDTDLFALLKYNLEKEGFALSGSQTGKGALDLCRQVRPDLILLDIMLPDYDGLEICKAVRKDPDLLTTPIIFLTARASETDRIVGLELGANDYTVKGFYTPRQILAKIKDLLSKLPPSDTVPAPAKASTFKVRMTTDWGEEPRFCAELGLTQGHPCPHCNTELVLELFPDYQRTDGHWFTGHLTCTSCLKSF